MSKEPESTTTTIPAAENGNRANCSDGLHDRPDNPATFFKNFFADAVTRQVLKHLILSIVLIGTVTASYYLFVWVGVRNGDHWFSQIRPTAAAVEAQWRIDGGCNGAKIEQAIQLQAQLTEIKNRAEHHLILTFYFFGNYFATILIFSIAGGTAAIALAVISRKGLSKANEYLISTFLVLTALAVFYQAFPGVFQQKINVEANRSLYVRYINLKDDIKTYCTTGEVLRDQTPLTGEQVLTALEQPRPVNAETPASSESSATSSKPIVSFNIKPERFILFVNYEMKKLNSIAIVLDDKQAPAYDQKRFGAQ